MESIRHKIIAFSIFLLLWIDVRAQINLVPNSSFEEYVDCNIFAFYNGKVKYWYNPTNCSPDYYNVCIAEGEAGHVPDLMVFPPIIVYFQYPRTGNAFVGGYTFNKGELNGSREYIQTKLSQALIIGKRYLTGAYFNLSESRNYATPPPQFKISKDRITNFNTTDCVLLNMEPDVKSSDFITSKTDWIKVEGIYTSTGGEEWLTIGNFYPDSLTDTLYVGPGGLNTGNSAYYFIDDVYVIPLDTTSGIDEYKLENVKIYPNQNSSAFTLETPDISSCQINICNILGQNVQQTICYGKSTQIDLSEQAPGIYIIMVWDDKGRWWNGKVLRE